MISQGAGELLAQLVPSVTTPVTLYENTGAQTVEIMLIQMAQVNPGTYELAVYHTPGGTTYNAVNLIGSGQLSSSTFTSLSTTGTFRAPCVGGGIMLAPGDSIGVQTDSANDVAFSIYGIPADIAQ